VASVSICHPLAATVAHSAFRAAKVLASRFRSSTRLARALSWDSIAAKAVLVFPRAASSSMAVSI
jgi:hypothetical protein